MKTKTKLLGSLLLVATIIMTPGTVRSQDLSIPFDDSAYQLIEQIQDLESMERDIARCYEAEKRTSMLAHLSRQSSTDSMQLNGELINRVFSHLAGAPEHERFVKVYHELIQSPDYKQLYSANLFAEYMRLIESARARLTTQLKERLRTFARESSTQFYAKSRFSESDPLNIVIRQYSGGAKTAQSDAVSPKKTEEARPILIDGGKGKDLKNHRR
ncbi:MAG: hypothetical protein WDL87_10100 [Candidatus Omnitrophota bacterium]|jgi:hypothetical protein